MTNEGVLDESQETFTSDRSVSWTVLCRSRMATLACFRRSDFFHRSYYDDNRGRFYSEINRIYGVSDLRKSSICDCWLLYAITPTGHLKWIFKDDGICEPLRSS